MASETGVPDIDGRPAVILQMLAQGAHGRRDSRLNGLRGETIGIEGRHGVTLRDPADIGRHTRFRTRVLRRRQRGEQQKQQDEHRRFHIS